MVKCPNCGSTAQVREATPLVTPDGEYIHFDFCCGCGIYFNQEEEEEK